MCARPLVRSAAVLALALSTSACVHAPAAPAAAPEAPPGKVLVTGSRIARPLGANGQPLTLSPVTIHTRDALVGTGAPADLGEALRRLEPAVGR